MKLAIFSDLHVHDWQEHSTDRSRLSHGVSVLQRVREYSVKHGIHAVLFGGDLFHKRGVLYTLPYNLVVAELALWREASLPLYANVGNHDAADRLAKVHALSALESAGLLRTVGGDGWATWEIVSEQGDAVVSAVAYCAEAGELRRRADAALADRESKLQGEFTIGLFHHGFRGARVGTSLEYVVKEDSDPDEYAKSFDLMLSGHYHAHQEIGTQGNAWYVGSPMEFVRNETSPKGFLVLDTEEAENRARHHPPAEVRQAHGRGDRRHRLRHPLPREGQLRRRRVRRAADALGVDRGRAARARRSRHARVPDALGQAAEVVAARRGPDDGRPPVAGGVHGARRSRPVGA